MVVSCNNHCVWHLDDIFHVKACSLALENFIYFYILLTLVSCPLLFWNFPQSNPMSEPIWFSFLYFHLLSWFLDWNLWSNFLILYSTHVHKTLFILVIFFYF